jgi:2-keto-4-pentenoate hydratase/2-oxohepta-3-ene-1,7-dioic acid hydratase in catechol pathway
MGILDGATLLVHEGDMFAGAKPTGETVDTTRARWLTPCAPSKMLALWNNFHAAAAKNNNPIPPEPLYFVKTANSFSPHGAPIPVPVSHDGRVIYEGELGVVIGRTARRVSEADAAAHVFGYTCINDVTAPELLRRDPTFPQWTRAKNFDGFTPFGPAIVTGIDPSGLTVRTLVDGRERQNYPVSDMIFSPLQAVSLISQDMTLYPGDIISCGTSLGAMPMKPGTVVEIVIEGVGLLRNVYGEPAA